MSLETSISCRRKTDAATAAINSRRIRICSTDRAPVQGNCLFNQFIKLQGMAVEVSWGDTVFQRDIGEDQSRLRSPCTLTHRTDLRHKIPL